MDTRRSSIILFLGVTFLFWVTLYLYVPTLPTYVKTKTMQLSVVGLVLSMYGLFMALIRLPMGIIGDAIGWGKPPIAVGIFLAALGAFIMGKVNTLFMLGTGRALTGLSAGTWVILIGVFSTFFKFEQAIFASSLLTFSASFGRMVGTALTGYLNRIGGYPLAFFLAAVTGVLAIILSLCVKEEKRSPKKASLKSIALLVVKREVLLPTVISIMIHYADWSVTFGFLPILAQQLGASDVIKSLLINLNIAGITSANLMNTLLLKRVGHGTLLGSGAFLFFMGIVLIAVAPTVLWLFCGTFCMGFAFGILYPILLGMSIQTVDRSERTTAMGIHQSFYAVGMFAGPWVSGIIADRLGIRPMFVLTAAVYLLTVYAFLYLLLLKKRVYQ
ncbi:MAG: hypothetical protein AMS17_13670 [Spirochaetes bacterium DG_61]|nr:MAG: hypothetical protein AMS17_13670 [Spirochaetes bacterium DG_61]